MQPILSRSSVFAAATLMSGLSLAVLLVGCGGETVGRSADGSAEVIQRDSAGIRIVEYAGDLVGDPLSVELVWEHGHGPGDYTFQSVSGGAPLSDGSAILSDGGNDEVIHVAADGATWSLLARKGRGPGEVMYPTLVLAEGADSVWVADGGNGRTVHFVAGAPDATLSLAQTANMGLMGQDEGGLFFGTSSYRRDFEQAWLDGYVARFDLAESRLDTVASYPMAPHVSPTNQNPFAPFGHARGAGAGFVHVRTDLPEVTWHNAAGDVVQIVRWRPTPRYPSEEDWDAFAASYQSQLNRLNPQLGGANLDAFVRERLATYAIDPSVPLPLFGLVVGGSDGSVWLPSFRPDGSWPTRYTVVSPDGTSIRRVDFPRPLQLLNANDSLVLGLETDALGVQAVVVYQLSEVGSP